MLTTWKFLWHHPLARRHRGAAYWRWAKWQLASRLTGGSQVVPFAGGKARLMMNRGMTGATGNLYAGLHEFHDMGFVLHYLRPSDGMIDVGANVGSYTVLAAKVCGARCVSVEPVAETAAVLRKNLELNGIEDRVQVLEAACGAASGTLRFSTDRDTMNQAVADDYDGESREVTSRSLDDIAEELPAALWKIDVEGGEIDVLQGGRKGLAQAALGAVLLESRSSEVAATMESEGFRPFRYDPFTRSFTEGWCGGPGSANQLWIRDLADAEERCASAPRRRIAGVEF